MQNAIAPCFKLKYSASGSIYYNKEATVTVQLTDKIIVNVVNVGWVERKRNPTVMLGNTSVPTPLATTQDARATQWLPNLLSSIPESTTLNPDFLPKPKP